MDYIITCIEKTPSGYSKLSCSDLILRNDSQFPILFLKGDCWSSQNYLDNLEVLGLMPSNFKTAGIESQSNASVWDEEFEFVPYTGNLTLLDFNITKSIIDSSLQTYTFEDVDSENSELVITYPMDIDHSSAIAISDLVSLYSDNNLWIVVSIFGLADLTNH